MSEKPMFDVVKPHAIPLFDKEAREVESLFADREDQCTHLRLRSRTKGKQKRIIGQVWEGKLMGKGDKFWPLYEGWVKTHFRLKFILECTNKKGEWLPVPPSQARSGTVDNPILEYGEYLGNDLHLADQKFADTLETFAHGIRCWTPCTCLFWRPSSCPIPEDSVQCFREVS